MNIDLDIKVSVSQYNVHIENSYTVDKRGVMRDVIKDLKKTFSVPVLKNRSTCSMVFEWVAHNNLYKLGIFRDRTKDVDLNWPQKWYVQLAWFLLGLIKI